MTVGHFLGREHLAAIGAATPIVAFFTGSLIAFSQGVSVLISRRTEENGDRGVAGTAGIVSAVSLILGVIIGTAGILAAPWMLRVIHTPESIIDSSVIYLRIYLAGMPFFLFYNFGSAVIRSLGNTAVSLVYVGISGLLNVVLNYAFIRLGGGIAGVAAATVLSQLLSAVLTGCYLYRNGLASWIRWRKVPEVTGALFRLGVPAAMQTMLLSLSNIFIQNEINRFGTTVLAAQTVYMSLNGFLLAAITAYTQTAIVFAGQNDAADNKKRVVDSAAYCCLLSFIWGSGLGVLFRICGEYVCIPYTDSREVTEVVMKLLLINAVPYGICGCMEALAGSVRGLGRSVEPTIMHLIGIGVFRIVWIMTFFRAHSNLKALYMCYPLSWVVTSVLQLSLLCIIIKKKYAHDREAEETVRIY